MTKCITSGCKNESALPVDIGLYDGPADGYDKLPSHWMDEIDPIYVCTDCAGKMYAKHKNASMGCKVVDKTGKAD